MSRFSDWGMLLSRRSAWGRGVICGVVVLAALVAAGPARAQGVDWRANLSCSEQEQIHAGLQYCTGRDRVGAIVHVIVIDLASPSIHFEYILPEGHSDGHQGSQECRDPNRPDWAGPAGGCFVGGNRGQYPHMSLLGAVERAGDVYPDQPVTVVINADYGAPNYNHGPEGLMVVRGQRLDGAARCDDDYNAVLRPWLGLGGAAAPDTGLIRAEIGRLVTDSASVPEWLATGIGGGPILVRNGVVNPLAGNCGGEATLHNPDPVLNCHMNHKNTPAGPLAEWYNAGSCRPTAHTAAGLSPDGRWLFFAISTSPSNPDVIAEFMAHQLGVAEAIKFDGGGSSMFWIDGEPDASIQYVGGENRRLTNFLAVYSHLGYGVTLPLSAALPAGGATVITLNEGETATLDIDMTNDGALSWKIEDGVALAKKPAVDLPFAQPERHPLPGDVAPGGRAGWSFPADSSGIHTYRYQMIQDDQYFGAEKQFLVIVVPQSLQDKRNELEAFIAGLQAQGQQEVEELAQAVMEWIKDEGAQIAEGFLRRALAALGDLLVDLAHGLLNALGAACNSVLLMPGAALGYVYWRRRRGG